MLKGTVLISDDIKQTVSETPQFQLPAASSPFKYVKMYYAKFDLYMGQEKNLL